MKSLISVINKIQDIHASVKLPLALDLPQIVVVGAQSTGKSSVLESIVGCDFLPRGSGIVTRRPIVLQLHTQSEGKPHAVFGHMPDKVFENFEVVRDEIGKDTDRVAGANKGISNKPIVIKIFSPDVIDLTLVDLPGLTKLPVGGQPEDIAEQIRKMVLEYVKNPNSIILAVSAANTDLANSDSLNLAREVDPEGERTVGVITKLDIMDKGTDALDILQGKTYPLKHGYIGVKCRSQEDIKNSKPMAEALKEEDEFFANSPNYTSIKSKCGIKFLARKLNTLLMKHIQNVIPALRSNISSLLHARQTELKSYGRDITEDTKENMGMTLLSFISSYVQYYQMTIDGTRIQASTKYLNGGARINHIFHEVFAKAVKSMKAFDGLDDNDIRTAIMNAKSLHPSLFIPEAAFETLIRQQIARLTDPSIQCMYLVHEELKRIVFNVDLPELIRFKKLLVKFSGIMSDLLARCLGPTEEMIKNLVIVTYPALIKALPAPR